MSGVKRTRKGDDEPWVAKGGKPSDEAIVRAYLVLLGHPPIITKEVRERLRRDEAARAREADRDVR